VAKSQDFHKSKDNLQFVYPLLLNYLIPLHPSPHDLQSFLYSGPKINILLVEAEVFQNLKRSPTVKNASGQGKIVQKSLKAQPPRRFPIPKLPILRISS
jgi:hypothetical protein